MVLSIGNLMLKEVGELLEVDFSVSIQVDTANNSVQFTVNQEKAERLEPDFEVCHADMAFVELVH